ncbi:MAG: STAS domain-containing protein [candidate division Zixibacteria bacterium]|nr:STAS domain-containing protein [candidate division Zixibacteria bacterium]
MKVKSYKLEDIVVIEPLEKFLTGDEVKELEERLTETHSSGVSKLVIDFSRTDLIYSAFISVLLMYSQKFKQTGGTIKLANLGPEVEKVFKVTRLFQIFESYPSLDEALKSFKDI